MEMLPPIFSSWKRVETGGNGWERVGTGGNGWERVGAGGNGWGEAIPIEIESLNHFPGR